MKAELMEKIRELIKAEVKEGIDANEYGAIAYGRDHATGADKVFAELLEMCSGKGRL